MKKVFFILIFILLFSSVFAFDLDIPLKNFEVNGVSVDRITLESEAEKVSVFITATDKYLADFNDIKLEELSRLYLNLLISLKIDFGHLNIMLRTDKGGEYRHVTEFLPKPVPVPKKEDEYEGAPSKPEKKSLVPQKKYGNIQGALTGKTLFVSAGHGWTYHTTSSSWATQRDISQGMREDDSNAEIVSYFLIPYLQNAGGTVFSLRERDRQENMVIIDDADGTAYAAQDGIYEENGSWAETTDAAGYGYGRTNYPIERDVNPLRNGRYRYANAGPGVWARWIPRIPEDGFYHVYVSYRAGTNRTDSAVYTVKHAGGSIEVTVNQQHHGTTWIDLGQFYFKAGFSEENASVTLSGESGIIIADAVRFGGGTGIIKRGNSTSGKPRWEESATHNVQFMGGQSGTTYHYVENDRDDDVSARSRWAAWENEEDYDDSLYIAIHSNGVDDTSVTGLSTWIYSNQAAGVGYEAGQAAAGSEELAALVQERILKSVQTLFDPGYKKYGRGIYSAYFGEINPSYNNEMPSCLVELAFHTSSTDAAMLKNPKYRDIASRAAYQAIVQYFAQKDGSEAVFLPGAPRNLSATVNSKVVLLAWDAPETDENRYLGDAPEGYIVQTSLDGVSFDDGVKTTSPHGGLLIDDYPDGTVLYARVLAYNKGGVSFPSAVVPVVVAKKKDVNILIVDGFERIDNAMPRFNEGAGANHRYILEHINSFDYARYYAPLLAELGYSFDFMPRTWISEFFFDSIPSKYDAILWFLGEQSTADETFNHEEQEKITEYLDNGGALFVSGAEIGWDLDYKGDSADKAFFNETLNAKYLADQSGLYTFFGIDDFSAISGSFDDGTYIYQPEYADVLAPFDENTGKTVLFYDDTESLGAGILTNTETKKVFVMGFPFETVLEKDNKINLLKYVFDEFAITPKEKPEDPIETPDDDSDSDTPDEDSSDTEDEDPDEDTADTGSEQPDEESADPTDTTDTSDSSDPSDPADTSDSSDSSDSADSDDSSDASDDKTDAEKGGKSGCSALLL